MNISDSERPTILDGSGSIQSSQIKFTSPEKWQKLMVESLLAMKTKYSSNKNLITDLITIVSAVPENRFIEAILHIRQLKPKYKQVMPVFLLQIENDPGSQFQEDNSKQNSAKQKITGYTLISQFEKGYHPFKSIIQNFKRLLQLKFKTLIDLKKLTNMQNLLVKLKQDMTIFNQFFHKSCQPLKKIFNNPTTGKQDSDDVQDKKFAKLIDGFLNSNENLCKTIHKIILYGSKTFYTDKFNTKIKDGLKVEQFNIPQPLRIDGCYVRSMNSLMEISEGFKGEAILQKMSELRENILIDINQFYKSTSKQPVQLEVNVEVYVQIMRFTIAKLKAWASQIFAQLKYLEYLNGQDIHFKYQTSSCVYSHLCIALQTYISDHLPQKN